MTKSEASRSSPRPLQLLVIGTGEQAGVFEDLVRAHTGQAEITVDRSEDFQNAQHKLAEHVYDLVLFAQDEPETQTAPMIQELQLRGERMPLLFLPGTPGHRDRAESHGDASTDASVSTLIQRFAAQPFWAEPSSSDGKRMIRSEPCTARSSSRRTWC